jgi:DUF4097 and DUF4098 domain-containing protein YvlB
MRIRFCALTLLVLLAIAGGASGHTPKPDRRKNTQQVERTMAVAPRVAVSVCVVSGDLTVRGWDRNEVRARSPDGTQIELARNDQMSSQPATELQVTSAGGHRTHANASCFPSADIQLDVPRGAALKLQTSSGDISVTEVARVDADSQSGDIVLTKVHGEVNLNTISGEISVRDSNGSFKLHTVGGGIEARTVGGEVTLDHLQMPNIKVNTVSGEMSFTGALARGGHYNFQSISGRLRLALPSDSSFRLSASLGEAVKFNSDFNLTYSENQRVSGVPSHGGFRRLEATAGSGSAVITVSLLEGAVQISKR